MFSSPIGDDGQLRLAWLAYQLSPKCSNSNGYLYTWLCYWIGWAGRWIESLMLQDSQGAAIARKSLEHRRTEDLRQLEWDAILVLLLHRHAIHLFTGSSSCAVSLARTLQCSRRECSRRSWSARHRRPERLLLLRLFIGMEATQHAVFLISVQSSMAQVPLFSLVVPIIGYLFFFLSSLTFAWSRFIR